jgi:hypothetical protein
MFSNNLLSITPYEYVTKATKQTNKGINFLPKYTARWKTSNVSEPHSGGNRFEFRPEKTLYSWFIRFPISST